MNDSATYRYSGVPINEISTRSLSFSLKTVGACKLNNISISNMRTGYSILVPQEQGGSAEVEQKINIRIAVNGVTYGEYKDLYTSWSTISFSLASADLRFNALETITITISGWFTDENENTSNVPFKTKVTSSLINPPQGGRCLINTSTSNIPQFEVNITTLELEYWRTKEVNGGYPYIPSNEVRDYGDYRGVLPPNDWYIDEDKIINIGYPFFWGGLTDYGDYIPKPAEGIYPIIAIYIVKKKST